MGGCGLGLERESGKQEKFDLLFRLCFSKREIRGGGEEIRTQDDWTRRELLAVPPALDGSMDAAMSSDSGKDVGPLTDELLRAELCP